jgi:uncharacterized membrane protein
MDWLDHGFNLILVYMIAGLCGTLWETGLYLVKDHRFVMSNGSIATPFNFVYGLGGVCICAALVNLKDYPWAVYLVGAALGGAVEYFVSVLEEILCHTRSWDYTGRLLSIRGRTTIPIMEGWGLLCLFIVYVLYIPFVEYVVSPFITDTADHQAIYHGVMWGCFAFILWDLFWVAMTMLRHQQRASGIPAHELVGKIVDRLFPDSYVAVHFPNAKLKPEFLPEKSPSATQKTEENPSSEDRKSRPI